MQVDGLSYALTEINKVIFGKNCIDIKSKIEFKLRPRSTYLVNIIGYASEIEITYPSLKRTQFGNNTQRDSIRIRDYIFPVVHCKFRDSCNSILLKNKKIYFLNEEIQNMFNHKSVYNDSIEHFDIDDIFALRTIFNGALDVELINILIDQYNQMKNNCSEMMITIHRNI